jgi:hypothetical protein
MSLSVPRLTSSTVKGGQQSSGAHLIGRSINDARRHRALQQARGTGRGQKERRLAPPFGSFLSILVFVFFCFC